MKFEIFNLMEKDMTLLGSTAIEDQIDDNVPDAIKDFVQIGIKIWLITGDKKDTSLSIAYGCKLFSHDFKLLDFDEKNSKEEINTDLDKFLSYLDNNRLKKKTGLIINSIQLDIISSDNELIEKVILNKF